MLDSLKKTLLTKGGGFSVDIEHSINQEVIEEKKIDKILLCWHVQQGK